jgi:hypothetical protein
MNEINIKQIDEIGPFWLVYAKENGEPAHIQLSACANNFSVLKNYESDDALKCVGLRYEQEGFGCYELFNVGHTRIKCPLRPNPFHLLKAVVKGKKAADLLREEYLAVEQQLNAQGWKTVEQEILR